MTKAVYNQIKAFFIDLWGAYAGWAHSVLFTADLRAFKFMAVHSDGLAIESELAEGTLFNSEVASTGELESKNSDIKGPTITSQTSSVLRDLEPAPLIKSEGLPAIESERAKRRSKRNQSLSKEASPKKVKIKNEHDI